MQENGSLAEPQQKMANEFQKDFVKNNAITKKLNVSQIIKVMLCLSLTGMLLLNVFYDTGNVPSAAHPVEFQDSSVPTFKKDINSTNRFRKEKALSTILVKSPHLDPLDYKSRVNNRILCTTGNRIYLGWMRFFSCGGTF